MEIDLDYRVHISNCLHSGYSYFNIDGDPYHITTNSTGCRYITFNGTKYITQNKNQDSLWGERARQGDKITWGIRPGSWIRIVNNKVEVP